jgi:hypothetical protein
MAEGDGAAGVGLLDKNVKMSANYYINVFWGAMEGGAVWVIW